MKKSLFRAGSVAALLFLLGNPKLAFTGASNGLILWASVVLPTLLPFMICSNVIVALDAIHLLTRPFRFLLRGILKLSDAGSYVLVSGLLCGYPMGAKTCSDFLDSNKISRKEGKYLLAISNHPSPMFLLGYVITQLGSDISKTTLLISLYLPVIAVAWAARKYYHVDKPSQTAAAVTRPSQTFDESLMGSCEVMVKIGGYIMLFSVLAAYLTAMPLSSPALKSCFLGIIEITTGIKAISVDMSGPVKVLCVIAATAFGGLSGVFQTKSVIKNAGLSIRHYMTWKTIHSVFSCIVFILLLAVHSAVR